MKNFIFLVFCSFFPGFCLMATKTFREYDKSSELVRSTYYESHTKQTVDFVTRKHQEYFPLRKKQMSLWQAFDLLDEIIDASDPDSEKKQTLHALQTAEAIRKDGHPRWLILTGLIHDMGKLLTTFGEPQWAVVGDTFPVGCSFESSNIFFEFFQDHPDLLCEKYNHKYGIYQPNCGFNQLIMSFGHDEYIYQVMKPYLPKEALYILRFHSFYPAHFEDGYQHFKNKEDEELLPFLKIFQKYDLYTKHDEEIDLEAVLPFYKELVKEFLPDLLMW